MQDIKVQKSAPNAPEKKKPRKISISLTRKNVLIIGSVLLLVATFLLGSVYGAHRQKEADKKTNPFTNRSASSSVTNRWTAVGTIVEVSESQVKLKDSRNQEKTAVITKETKIVDRKGTAVAAKDLKKDQRVIASGEKDGDKLTATRIRLQQ